MTAAPPMSMASPRATQSMSGRRATARSPRPTRTRRFAAMRRSSCAALAAVLMAGSAARADELSDVVPGHPGVTYGALLKQVMPAMQKNTDGGWDSGPVTHFRDLDGKPVQELEISFKSVEATTVREEGHKRLLLMTDEDSGGSGFDAVLAAYDLDARTPKLLDHVDAGRDRWNGISSRIVPLSATTDAFIAFSGHSNSNQSYELVTPMFLRSGKFHTITSLFVYGEGMCSYDRRQEASYATRPDKGAEYDAFVITFTIDTRPGESDCGERQKPPQYSKTTVSDTWRWNARKGAFVATTGTLDKLSERNFKLATQ